MDYRFKGNNPLYYNNYNNIGNMDFVPFYNFNETPLSNDDYIKDLMLAEAKQKRQKKKFSSLDCNINNYIGVKNRDIFNHINYTAKKNNNNNFEKILEKYSNINNDIYNNNIMNNYTKYNIKQNDNIHTEIFDRNKNKNLDKPFRYQRKFPESKEVNNNNYLKRISNNERLKNENFTLNKNINFINNRNNHITGTNHVNNHIFYHSNKKQQNIPKPNTMMRKERYNNQPMNINNNISLNINNKNNVIYGKITNMRGSGEIPRHLLNNNKINNFNRNINQNNRNNNNLNEKILKNINKRKKNEFKEEEEENLSNLADDLYNLGKENKVKKNKNDSSKNDVININKNKEEKKIINNDIKVKESSTRNKNNQMEEFGCQAELSRKSNDNNNSSRVNSNSNRVINKKPDKVDSYNDIQASLMPLPIQPLNNLEQANKILEFQISNVNCFNIINEKDEKIKEDESKKDENKDIIINNFIKNSENNEKNDKQKLEEVNNNNESSGFKKEDRKNGSNIINNDLENLGEEIIDNDNEKEIEEKEKKKKKNRRIQIDLNQNIYFNFLQNDIITACQVKKGQNGDLENYIPKNEEDNMDSLIMFELKSAIKPFKIEEIKIDKNYKLRENMEEWRIIPELYEDEEVEENVINNLANSLKASIDKSTDVSINESLKRSIQQSYNQSMAGSLLTSVNNEGQGILRRLTAAFGESLNIDE